MVSKEGLEKEIEDALLLVVSGKAAVGRSREPGKTWFNGGKGNTGTSVALLLG